MTINDGSADRRALLQSALQALDDMQAKLDRVESAGREPIAIIGMSCRFPGGATSPEAYWDLLRDGRDAVTEYPAARREIAEAAGVDLSMLGDDTRWFGGFLDEIDQFDPQFFGISPREAATMDPQQRLVLEVSWEALERAGVAPDSLNGTATGVFVGITTNEYIQLAKLGGPEGLDVYSATGGALNAAPGRVAYTLGLQGPCMAIDTACSSSLVALHQACQSLRVGESNLALAGGVNILLLPEAFICFNRWGMMAPDGRCKTFDAAANGFVRGEGCGMLVLKRLTDAVADGDPILAVIRGSAVNQDGRSSGLTVPNGLAQQAVLRQALSSAGVDPADIQYFEAHGTGTTLGDPIEVEAVGAVLGRGRGSARQLVMGSVKTNIGHLESASGIAGVIKVLLSMQHGQIPPHLHFSEPSPQIPWPAFPVIVPTELTPWPAADGHRLAGVSGFGFSGTNAHVVLESAPPREASDDPAPDNIQRILTLSARSEPALRALAGRYASFLDKHPEVSLADVCVTAATGRAVLPQRLALVADSPATMRDRLEAYAAGSEVPGGAAGRAGRPKVAFLFTGQGAQYPGMAHGLYESEAVFRDSLDRCAALLDPALGDAFGESLLGVVFAEEASARSAMLDQTGFTQPALFAVEYALVELWRSWGVVPHGLLGHSVGEYVAAVVAGVVSLEDGCRLIASRGRLMQQLPAGGAMAAVFAPVAEVAAEVAATGSSLLSVAAVNGPAHTVVSGDASAVAAVAETFAGRGVRVRPLTVSHAFHSPLMEPMIDEFRQVAESITYHPPTITIVSNVDGAIADATIATSDYWVRHVLAPVQFAAGMASLQASGFDAFVEIGPHPVLSGMGQSCTPGEGVTWVPSLRRNRDDHEQILTSVGAMYAIGSRLNWNAILPSGRRREMPTYPFQRQRYWIDPVKRSRRPSGVADGHPLLGSSTRAPLLGATIHQAVIAADSPAWLDDHRLAGTVVFPGTAFTEMILAASDPTSDVIESLAISEPLVVPEDGDIDLQTVVTPLEPRRDGVREVQIVSLEPAVPDAGRWKLHARATVRPRRLDTTPVPAVDIGELIAKFADEVDVTGYYAHLRSIGLTYGPTFRGLTRLMRRDGAALGHVSLPAEITDGSRYHLHPALFDACFHVLGVAVAAPDEADADADDMFVPVAVEGLRLHRSGASAAWCAVTILGDPTATRMSIAARLDVYGNDGSVVATIDRLEVRRTPRSMWQRGLGAVQLPLYELSWQVRPRTADPVRARDWLILGDRSGWAEELMKRLAADGSECTLVGAGTDATQLDAILVRAVSCSTSSLGVVYLRALDDATAHDIADVDQGVEHALHGALATAQSLAGQATTDCRLFLVTRGAQSLDGEPSSSVQATLWGLGRVVANEQPNLHCTCIDIDPGGRFDAIDELAAELLGAGHEDQIALRGHRRSVARLVRRRADVPADGPIPMPHQLQLAERGSLDALSFSPLQRRVPVEGEIEIEVRATGINFRDVLNVLGMYPGDPGPPGLECAGVVAAIGQGVVDVAVGDAVLGIAPQAFDSHVITRAELVVRKPEALTFAEAATVPIAYLTAAYGLQHLAQLQQGERVLIHAAAGGVGLAAVHIAQRIGAEVYATVGSAEKRRALEALGVEHIYNSRTLDFGEQIRVDTGGAGVDVVLNSLADDFIASSFDVLAPTGRFLEIGKRGIWSTEQARSVRPSGSYHAYDLADFLLADTDGVHASLQNIVDDIAAGRAAPLPLRAFPAEHIESAFRYMAQARHIGKVVLTHRPLAPHVRDDGAYLVTGGLGGLGLTLAGWLVEQGARHVTVTGRSEPSAAAVDTIAKLEAAGADIRVVQADITRAADVERVLAAATERAPLRGVFHAAGVIDDGALGQQTWSRFERVLAPKLHGAWLLDRATRAADLDHFVLFSSASALLGAPGQSNYAAANSALDALARGRRAAGLPALSVNWGAWAEVGMATRLDQHERRRMADRGVRLLEPEDALDALDQLLEGTTDQAVVLAIDWPTMLAQFAPAGPPPLLAELAASTAQRTEDVSPGGGQALRAALAGAPADEHRRIVFAYVEEQIVRVLGLTAGQPIDAEQDVAELGMDSLMAVELSNRLRAGTGLGLASTLAFEHPTVAALADHLIGELDLHPVDPDVAAGLAPTSIVAVGRHEPILASSAQQRLLFFDQFAPRLAIYNVPLVLRLRGAVDVEAVDAAIVELVRRHEALRTNFVFDGGRYLQVILEPDDAVVEIAHRDVRNLESAAVDDEVCREVAQPFDLQADVKLRAVVMQTATDEYLLVMTMHHIATDGWSTTHLVAELAEIYSARVDGREAVLAELALQYADFAAWQRSAEQSAGHRERLAYWTEVLSGTLPVLDLPTDRPRPAVQSYRGGSVRFDLGPEVVAGVRAAARAAGVTPFVFLLSAYVATLARWTDQDDFVVGTATANRSRAETNDVVGMFVNMVAIRAGIDLEQPFTSLLDDVKKAVLGAFRHEDVPFNRIVEVVNPPRDLSRSIIFQTIFVLNNMPIPDVHLAGLEVDVVDASAGATEYDIAIWITETGDRAHAVVEFNADVFDASTVERLMEHWQRLLTGAVADTSVPIGELPLMPDDERHTLLSRWGVSSVDPLDPLDALAGSAAVRRVEQLVALRTLESPSAVAIDHDGDSLTYAELDERSNRLARVLIDVGVVRGDRVGVAVERSPAMVVSLLAVLKSGAAYVPLDPAFPAERLQFMVADAGVTVAVASAGALDDRLDLSALTVLEVDRAEIARLDDGPLAVDESDATGAEVAYVMYTSGSTGLPKGVEIEHRSVANLLMSMLREPGIGPDDVLLAVTTLSFDISVLELFGPLVCGGRLVIAARDDAVDGRRLAALIESSHATVMQATPTTWSMLFDAGWQGAPGLKVLCGGETMPVELGRRLLDGCGSVWNMFGPTETTIWSTVHRVDPASLLRTRVPIGRPIANTVCRVLDASGALVPVGVPGELLIGGAGLARGYLKRDELTLERFVADPFEPAARLYRTGDLARWLADGTLEHLGRLDLQVKIRGHRIELGEIETALRAHADVVDAVVIADGRAAAARLLAYVISVDLDSPPSAGDLRAWLQRRLPDYMIPSRIVTIDAFPTTPNRKIDRNALPKPDTAAPLGTDYVAPRNEPERIIAGIIADTLDLDEVGINDNFFELGGHSLHATTVLADIEARFGTTIELRSFFLEPTVAALAVNLATAAGNVVAPIVPVARDEMIPASSAQQRLLFFDQFAPANSIYNLPMALRLRGDVDVDVLEGSIVEIVHRHEALRTNFARSSSHYLQVIVDPGALERPVSRRDLRHLDPSAADLVALAELAHEFSRPFDLLNGIKLRAVIIQLARDEFILAMTFHHIATDGWSITKLVGELAEIYAARSSGREPQLRALPVQYADYSVWQHQLEQAEGHHRTLEYWLDTLGGTLPVLDLPADHPRPAVQSYRSGSVRFDIEPEFLAALRAAARSAGVTPFVFLLATYIATLARWSGQDDFIVGTASANRSRPEVQDVVGLFVNMVAIRAGVDLDQPFDSLLDNVREAALGAFLHEDVPFNRVVETINPPRDLSRSIVFQTIFVLNNMPMPDVDLADFTVDPIDASPGATEFDLAFWVTEIGDRARALVEFNADVFDASTVERLMAHWRLLSAGAVADPSLPISGLPLMPVGEQTVLREFATPDVDVQGSIPGVVRLDELVGLRLFESPNAVAVDDVSEALTYVELDERSNRLARALVSAGVRPGDRVGVAVERSAAMVVSLLAVLKSGAAYVPLDPGFPSERLAFMVADAGVHVALVSSGSLQGRVDVSGLTVIDVVDGWELIEEFDATGLEIDSSCEVGGGVAYVIYTSGSTGMPKGVEIEHRSVINFVLSMLNEPGLVAGDVLLAVTTLSFDISVLEIFVPLAAGARVVVASRDDAMDGRRLARLIDASRATVMQATPTTWSMLFEAGWQGAPGLKVLCGGEAMPVELGRRLLDCCGSVWNMFGPTETTIWSTVHHVNDASLSRANVPIGRPIANTVCRVLDASGALAPVGVPGELLIGGVGVARGYLDREELTRERFVADPFDPGHRLYRTGDLVRWLPDGMLECLGRLDLQVKVRGHRIELGEIESALRAHPDVVDAIVIADGQAAAARLVAYLVPVDLDQPPTIGDLRGWLKERLPDYMIPALFVTIDAFPTTPNRKIDRNALPRPEHSVALVTEYVAPRNDAERIVAGIVAETLELERVGIDDSFFELGGHSLHATRVLARIEASFGTTIELRSFFLEPTVAAVAAMLAAGAASSPSPVVPVPRDTPMPASSAQQRLLFLDQFAPGIAVFNLPIAFRLRGFVDLDVLESAIVELVRRHEALRTNFVLTDGGHVQVIVGADDIEVPVPRRHLSDVGATTVAAVLDEEMTREFSRPFDLLGGLKLRAVVFVLPRDEYVVAMTVHHIAADGWSISKLVGELAELYSARSTGRQAELPELPVQYADYSVWQHAIEQSAGHREKLDYWTETLSGALPVLDLPADRPRPAVSNMHSASVRFDLDSDLVHDVRAAAGALGVTPFVLMLSAYVATLARWSGQDDFVVGTASANRSRPELNDVVGMFVNLLAIRVGVQSEQPFASLVDEVKASVLGAFAHEGVPFDRVVEAINPPRDLSRSIVFQTVFVLNNMPMPDVDMANVVMQPVEVEPPASEYDIAMWVTEHGDEARVSVVFNADVFDRSTVERLMSHWRVLLAAAVTDPTVVVAALPLMPAEERQTLLVEFASPTKGPSSVDGISRLDELVGLRALTTPDAVAFEHRGDVLTYFELDRRSNQLARRLVADGVLPGARVGIGVERSTTMVVSVMAVMKAGAAYVPLDPGFPVERLTFMMSDAGLDVVLESSGSLSGRIDMAGLTVVDVVDEWDTISEIDGSSLHIDTAREPGGGSGWVIYTSGSTGLPKGVEVEHASAINFVLAMLQEPGITADDVLLAVPTLSFDPSVLDLFVPALAGARVVIASREDTMDPRRLAALIESSGATVMQATPTTWTMLFEAGWTGSSALTALCGGEAMPVDLARRLRTVCRSVWNLYGPTETTVWSTTHEVTDSSLFRVNVPIGRPIANMVYRVLDSAGDLSPIGVPGELYIGGVGVARGYLNRVELTAEKFVADPFQADARLYRTGDLARWLPDGNLEFLGRRDFQVKLRGNRIELGEIESALRAHDGVVDAVVVADGQAATARLFGYLIPVDPEAPPTVAELRAWLQKRLPDYMIPSLFVTIDEFPLTPNRKIDRKALPRPDSTVSVATEYVPPRNDTERVIAAIVAETLDVERVGVEDNFFELGGHSLHVTSVLAKIDSILGATVELRTFFLDPTVAATAASLLGDAIAGARVERVAQLRSTLDEMSSEEVAALLAAKRASGAAGDR